MKPLLSSKNQFLKKASRHKRGYLFLDFDGTLSHIVDHHMKARMTPDVRRALKTFLKNHLWKTAIVSGRSLEFLNKVANLPGMIFVGNHGFEIKRPGKKIQIHPFARRAKKPIAKLCRLLKPKLAHLPGILVENKKWSASVHTRRATKAHEKEAEKIFWEIARPFIKKKIVQVTTGKRILEIRPHGKWNKGEAVKYILKSERGRPFPVYIGDDKTDEDAFAVLKKSGVGIRVGMLKKSHATYRVRSVHEMPKTLHFLNSIFSKDAD